MNLIGYNVSTLFILLYVRQSAIKLLRKVRRSVKLYIQCSQSITATFSATPIECHRCVFQNLWILVNIVFENIKRLLRSYVYKRTKLRLSQTKTQASVAYPRPLARDIIVSLYVKFFWHWTGSLFLADSIVSCLCYGSSKVTARASMSETEQEVCNRDICVTFTFEWEHEEKCSHPPAQLMCGCLLINDTAFMLQRIQCSNDRDS